MASQQQADDSDDGMDEFMDKFKKEKYKNGFNESTWEEEFDRVPMFMKSVPDVIDSSTHPELACIQSIIHDDDRSPEEHAESLKDEGNAFFKEKNYKRAILAYTEGLKKTCSNNNLNAILHTNRAAAHFHLGNMRSALTDAAAARRLKPDHLKALIRGRGAETLPQGSPILVLEGRCPEGFQCFPAPAHLSLIKGHYEASTELGAQCFIELKRYTEALHWAEDGLRLQPTDKKLQELRAAADKQKRALERDVRKAEVKRKKERGLRETLLAAIKERGIKLLKPERSSKRSSDSEEEDGDPAGRGELDLDGLGSQEATGVSVSLDEQGNLQWPVLFLYPEHQQTDFISAFRESSSFSDNLAVMFGEELPPWDEDRKYLPQNLLLFFEDYERESLYQVDPDKSLLEILQHKRYLVKAGSPSFIVLVKDSSFCKQFLSGKKWHRL